MIDEAKAQLLPCPFCGAGDTQLREVKHWTGMSSVVLSVSVYHWCEPVEGQPGRVIERIGRDEESAIAAWNRRVALSPARVEGGEDVQALKDRINKAIHRVTHGEGQMRVPVDPTDPDVVLGDCFVMLESLSAQLAHWKANHADMVRRNAVLSQRPDLPVDRLPAIAEYEKVINRLATELDAMRRQLVGYQAAERSINEALNSGDGSYRP
jgi:hypothetical protein